ncbi:MAG: hypothetical protein ACR2PR_09240 [Pseudohongiellaceae bacterium]
MNDTTQTREGYAERDNNPKPADTAKHETAHEPENPDLEFTRALTELNTRPGQKLELGGAICVYQKPSGLRIGSDSTTLRRQQIAGAAAYAVGPQPWVITQKGVLRESGSNGWLAEHFAAAAIDILQRFQDGKFPCDENEEALNHFRKGLAALDKRTMARMEQGVEGKHEKHESPRPTDDKVGLKTRDYAYLYGISIQTAIASAIAKTKSLISEHPSRENSLTLTKLEEAFFWRKRGDSKVDAGIIPHKHKS